MLKITNIPSKYVKLETLISDIEKTKPIKNTVKNTAFNLSEHVETESKILDKEIALYSYLKENPSLSNMLYVFKRKPNSFNEIMSSFKKVIEPRNFVTNRDKKVKLETLLKDLSTDYIDKYRYSKKYRNATILGERIDLNSIVPAPKTFKERIKRAMIFV